MTRVVPAEGYEEPVDIHKSDESRDSTFDDLEAYVTGIFVCWPPFAVLCFLSL